MSKAGPLVTISCLLICSAVLRVALNADVAVAAISQPVSESMPSCDVAPDLALALEQVKARNSDLEEKEQLIAQQMVALEDSKQALSGQLRELINAEQALSATLATAKTAAKSDLAQLAEVYMAMKPKQAAAVFEEMDPEFASGFLSMMTSDAAASILAGMTPSKAYALSAILAGRHVNVPTE